jgi:hypothetical protein
MQYRDGAEQDTRCLELNAVPLRHGRERLVSHGLWVALVTRHCNFASSIGWPLAKCVPQESYESLARSVCGFVRGRNAKDAPYRAMTVPPTQTVVAGQLLFCTVCGPIASFGLS